MSDPHSPAAVQARIRRTWPIFFARHGNLTDVQLASIPPILDGKNTLIVSATASGKTEAAVVPLIERHFRYRGARANQGKGLRVLFICPTRALTRDLYERLNGPLAELKISLAMKTGDTAGVSYRNPPSILITTPESTDSLLTRAPRLFTGLQAIVLDEIHLFDSEPRGDHLLCLLQRIEHIRAYAQAQQQEQQRTSGASAIIEQPPLQRIALSATIPDPRGLAQRYLQPYEATADAEPSTMNGNPPPLADTVEIVVVSGQRELDAVIEPMGDLADLAMQMNLRAGPPVEARKSLVFCNTRNEVEQTATFLRRYLAYDASVFVHYSNLDSKMRLQVEEDFAQAGVAACVCTSTLELGIDIGSIDDVVLIGPPPSLTSFLQRIGRGGRRTQRTRVLCLARSALEEVRFHSLIMLVQEGRMSLTRPRYHFRPSVLVQQIFSILKQSPTGAIRLPDLRRVVPPVVSQTAPFSDEELRDIFRNLVREEYLKSGRLGEWRPGPQLDELLDAHEIYSNIGSDPLKTQIVDTFSGRTIAQTDRSRQVGETFLMGGRLLEVVWKDRDRIGVEASGQRSEAEEMRFATAPFALTFELSQGIAKYLGLRPGQMVLLREEGATWLFHFWGAIYGKLLAATLRTQLYPETLQLGRDSARGAAASGHDEDVTEDVAEEGDEADGTEEEESLPLINADHELCIRLPEPLLQLPPLDTRIAFRELRRLAPRVEQHLSLGRFHSLLPPSLGHHTVVELCEFGRFERLFQSATIITPEPQSELAQALARLL